MVLIIADDLAWDDCGPFGNPTTRTPNLNRLAREGMSFDRAFLTCSSSSPSRSSHLIGRYPHNTGAEELHWPLPADQAAFTEQFKASGYYTAAAGKWHLGGPAKAKFDEISEDNPRGFQLPTEADQPEDSRSIGFEGAGASQAGCDQWEPVLTDRPFFLWLASLDLHRDYFEGAIPEPHDPSEMIVPPFLPDTSDVRTDLAMHADEVTRFDHFIGAVLDELENQGVASETLVVFIRDNSRPFPRCKTTVYDDGIRTPMIVRWP